MAITRKLPNSDEERNIAIHTAKTKKDNTPASGIPIIPGTIVHLDTTHPLFSSRMHARGTALTTQNVATTAGTMKTTLQ